MEPLQVKEYQPIPATCKEKPKVERRDAYFVLISFVIGFAFCEFILFGGLGIAVPAFYAVFYLAACAYLHKNHKVFNKAAILTAVPILLFLLCFILYDNVTLRFFNVLALWCVTALNFAALCGIESRPLLWAGTWYDILKVTFFLPFHHMDMPVAALSKVGKAGSRHSVLKAVVTLLVISPVILIVLSLLASSDAGFERLVNTITGFITARVMQYVMKTILAVMLTFPIFSLLYSMRYDKRPERHPLDGFLLRLGAFDTLVTVVALSAFSLIYAAYMAVQADYFFSAIQGVLPQAFTYAEYARRGFFELVGVAAINFCMIAAAGAFTKRSAGRITRGSRCSIILLAVMTLLIILTAVSKMVLYVHSYGLTPLRVYTSFFMLILAMITVFIIIKMVSPRFAFYQFAVVGTIALYLALNFLNTDRIIAQYNINMYQQNKSIALDTTLFYDLSDSAIPQIVTLRSDPKYANDISEFLRNRKATAQSGGWQEFSVAKYDAQRIVNGK